ncbi:GPP34 family phosphoprotein [Streptomyces sp. VRA16 Mangrove soil]|uniref:GOLPH3/VPS74 family protein n=1 Tax=Streptomyces sp. VRA16 Mangrove soil TaxID=2817434 RepID=UPI001A9CDF3D|nr:GPP34 family phosphoprotein [Streptomyces sp. VRA16 Mangrove soil]MBO1329643.1 GPP34 family phosphoprotein [Streptomyces sp. VRA16 Mangrove soil]
MPHGSLPLPARLFLLAHDPGKGRVTGAPDVVLAVRAGALAELAARALVQETDGTVTPVLDARADDPVLDELLELIGESRPRTWRGLITHRARGTRDTVRRELAAQGYLRAERRRVLGLFPATRYVLARAGYVQVLRAEARVALTGPAAPEAVHPDQAALVVLAAAGHFRGLLSWRERRRHAERLSALAEHAGPYVPQLRKALEAEVRKAEAARASDGGGGG